MSKRSHTYGDDMSNELIGAAFLGFNIGAVLLLLLLAWYRKWEACLWILGPLLMFWAWLLSNPYIFAVSFACIFSAAKMHENREGKEFERGLFGD